MRPVAIGRIETVTAIPVVGSPHQLTPSLQYDIDLLLELLWPTGDHIDVNGSQRSFISDAIQGENAEPAYPVVGSPPPDKC